MKNKRLIILLIILFGLLMMFPYLFIKGMQQQSKIDNNNIEIDYVK